MVQNIMNTPDDSPDILELSATGVDQPDRSALNEIVNYKKGKIEDRHYENLLEQFNGDRIKALNSTINELGSGEFGNPDLANRLRELNKIPKFNDRKTAEEQLGGGKPIYISPVEGKANGIFVETTGPIKTEGIFDTFTKQLEKPDWWKSEEGLEYIHNIKNRQAAMVEAVGVGTVDALEGLLSLPILLEQYTSPLINPNIFARLIGDMFTTAEQGDVVHSQYAEQEIEHQSGLTEKELDILGAPYRGRELYFQSVKQSPANLVLKQLKEIFDPYRKAIERNIGSPAADWINYPETQVGRLASEIFAGGTPFFKGVKAIVTPIQTTKRIGSAIGTLSLSNALGKSLSATIDPSLIPKRAIIEATGPRLRSKLHPLEEGVHGPLFRELVREPGKVKRIKMPMSAATKNWIEFDAAVGGAIAYYGTKNLLGEENPYSEVIALPMLLVGAVVSPGQLLERTGKFAGKTVSNHTFRLMDWLWGGYPARKSTAVSPIGWPKSPFNNPEKAEKIQAWYLSVRGVPDDVIEKARISGDLKTKTYEMRLNQYAEQDVKRLAAAINRLEEQDPVQHKALVDRMEMNYTHLMRLRQVAIDHLPEGSRESIGIYVSNLTELSWMEQLQKTIVQHDEGFRLTKRIDMYTRYGSLQTSQERIQKANVQLLRHIQNNAINNAERSDEFNILIDFMEKANRSVDGAIKDSASTLDNLLEKGNLKRNLRKKESKYDLNESLHSEATRRKIEDGDLNYVEGQRIIINKIFKDDKGWMDSKYTALGDDFFDVELDSTYLRDILRGLVNSEDASQETIDAITTLAQKHLSPSAVKGVSASMTRQGLSNLDNDGLINILEQADLSLGKPQPADYSKLDRNQLINKILSEKVQTSDILDMIPATITLEKLKDFMSGLGSLYGKNIGNQKGRSVMGLWQKANEMIDPTSPNFRKPEGDFKSLGNAAAVERMMLAFKETQDVFKNRIVPRWKKGYGENLMRTDDKLGSVPDEMLFNRFFSNDQLAERANLFRTLIHQMEEGPNRKLILRDKEDVDELLKFFKYGLYQKLNSSDFNFEEVDRILTNYGSKGGAQYDVLDRIDPKLKGRLREYRDANSEGWGISHEKVNSVAKGISNLIKGLKTTRLDILKKSGISKLSGLDNPDDFFTQENIFIKSADLTAEDQAMFSDLITESKRQGDWKTRAFGDEPVSRPDGWEAFPESEEAVQLLLGRTTEDISMTPYEFIKRMTKGKDGEPFTLVVDGREVGKEILEKIREMYAIDIARSSIKVSGRKTTLLGKDKKGNTIPIMEEIIDYPTFIEKLKATEKIRGEIYKGVETQYGSVNDLLDEVVEHSEVLSPTTRADTVIGGLATGFRLSSLMARGFAIARGVLSLRYVAGELTLQHMRLQYVNMMKELLVDPDASRILMQLVRHHKSGQIKSMYSQLRHKEGLKALAKFMGINASELSGISEDHYNYIVDNNGELSGEQTKEYIAKANVKRDKEDRWWTTPRSGMGHLKAVGEEMSRLFNK